MNAMPTQPINAQPIVFLDTETGGTDPATSPLLTVGLITLTGDELSRPLHLKVKHDSYTVRAEAMAVNGIDLVAHHREAQPPAEVAQAIREYAAEVGRVILGGHNFSFDLGFMRRLMPDLYSVFRRGFVDTKLSAQFLIHAGLLPRSVGTPLDQLTKHFGIEYGAHDALEDAQATAKVYVKLMELARGREKTQNVFD